MFLLLLTPLTLDNRVVGAKSFSVKGWIIASSRDEGISIVLGLKLRLILINQGIQQGVFQ